VDRAFSPWYDLAPPHPLRLSLQLVVSLSQSSCVSLVKLTEGKGGGVGEEPNNMMRESLVLYKSFNTLCSTLSDVAGTEPIITLPINRITLLVRFISPVFSFTFSVLTLLVIGFVTIFRIINSWKKEKSFYFFSLHQGSPKSRKLSMLRKKINCFNFRGPLKQYSFNDEVPLKYSNCILKGQCHEIFCFWFFSWISLPLAPEYPVRTVSKFLEIRGDIRKSRCTIGINDTGCK